MPLLEAMARECPVVCSRIPAFLEVAGDAPEYFDPTQPSSLAKALESIVQNGRERSAAGLLRVRQFSWEKCAKETAAAYLAAIS